MKTGRPIASTNKNKVSNASGTSPTYWSYENLRISDKGVSEVIAGRRMLFIPKEQVRYIETKFGSHAERPLFQMVLGLLLVALGLVGLYLVLSGGIRGLYWGVGFLGFGAIGVYCLYEAFKKGYFFSVVCSKETRKIKIPGEIQKAEFSQFIKDASEAGYDVRDSWARFPAQHA
jgi:hypothetical protein